MKVFMTADDLTGALDSAVQLRRYALRTLVFPCFASSFPAGIDAAVINTESRHLTARAAYDRVYEAVSKVKDFGSDIVFYKKIDSALRGNIGAELEAMLQASGRDTMWLVPAYPDTGRTTQEGIQYVDGVPVFESQFGNDSLNSLKNSCIASIIKEQTDLEAAHCKSDLNVKKIAEIMFVDAATNGELNQIAATLLDRRGSFCFSGSAGFAAALARHLHNDLEIIKDACLETSGLIAVCGSIQPSAVEQLAAAQEAGLPVYTLSPSEKFCSGFTAPAISDDTIIICSASSQADVPAANEAICTAGIHADAAAACVAGKMAKYLAYFAEKHENAALCVVGGDTLSAVVKELDCREIRPEFELFPGTVVSEIQTKFGLRKLITRSGGFTHRDFYIDSIRQMNSY